MLQNAEEAVRSPLSQGENYFKNFNRDNKGRFPFVYQIKVWMETMINFSAKI